MWPLPKKRTDVAIKNRYGELDDYWYMPFAVPSVTGVEVTETTALKYTTVWACVRLISETIASLPLNVYRSLADGGKEKVPSHQLFNILHYQPNPEMTAFQYRESGASNLLLWGNWYSWIERNRSQQIVALWPLNPANMTPIREGDSDKGRLIYEYRYTVGGQTIYFDSEEILHIPGLGFNGLLGYSPIKMAQEAIGLGLASEELSTRFFANDASPGGILRHPMRLSPQARDNLKESLTKGHGGLKNKWLPMILEEGMEWKETTMPLKDAQFLETRKFQRSEICSFFRVPPHLIGDTEPSTSWGSGIEQQSIGFIVFVIRPWLVRIEQAYRAKLFGDNKRIEFFAEHSVEGLLRGDSAARATFYKTMWEIGAYSPNDILEKENMNPIPNGDKHYVPLNYIELGKEPPPPPSKPKVGDVAIKEEDMSAEERAELSRLRMEVIELRNKADLLAIEKKKLESENSEFGQKLGEKDELIRKMSEEIIRIKNGENYRHLFNDAVSRIIRRESVAIKRALQKKSLSDFNNYLEEFYKELPEFASSVLHPCAISFGQIMNSTGAVNSISEYVPKHISESRNEISKWTGVYLHDTTDFRRDEKGIDDCIDLWLEKRPDRAASVFVTQMSV